MSSLHHWWSSICNRVRSLPEDHLTSTGIVLLIACLTLGQSSWRRGYFHDGYLYAGLSKSIAENGNWLAPHFAPTFDNQYFDHPPFFLWYQAGFFKLFGASWTTSRISNSILSLAVIAILFSLVRRETQDRWWTFYAGIILALTPPFIKTSNFPNLDCALTLFISISFACAYISSIRGGYRWWIITGISFGISALLKGPPAAVVPAGIVVYLLMAGKIRQLLHPAPWIGLFLGMSMFCIWPLLLAYNGHWEGFLEWYNRQIVGTVVEGRGEARIQPFFYARYLFKTTGPWFPLAIFGAWKLWKNRKEDTLGVLFLAWLLVVLVPFSLVRHKYNHYLLPLYPALAGLAAYPLARAPESFRRWSAYSIRPLAVIAVVVFLVFPISVQTRRNKELFQLHDVVQHLPQKPTDWVCLNGLYDYPFSTFVVWVPEAIPHRYPLGSLEALLSSSTERTWLLLAPARDEAAINKQFPNKFRVILRMPRRNSVAFIESALWPRNGLVAPETNYP